MQGGRRRERSSLRELAVRPKTPRCAGLRRPHAPWHFLYFLPLPHQQGSLRPTLSCSSLTTVSTGSGIPPPSASSAASAPDSPAAIPPPAATCCRAEG